MQELIQQANAVASRSEVGGVTANYNLPLSNATNQTAFVPGADLMLYGAVALAATAIPDEFRMTTGPVSRAMRRGCFGGKAFWYIDAHKMFVRTTPLLCAKEDACVVLEPPERKPIINPSNVAQRNEIAQAFVQQEWVDASLLGVDEADWFAVLVGSHFDDGYSGGRRKREDKTTWVKISVGSLNRWRGRDPRNGFRNEAEYEDHRKALERVLRCKFLWNSSKTGGPKITSPSPMWQVKRVSIGSTKGRRQIEEYHVFPGEWLDHEMSSNTGHAPMFLDNVPRSIIQIPANKQSTKAIAHFLVGSFWRMAATKESSYSITIGDLHDKAGLSLGEQGRHTPSKYVGRLKKQVEDLCSREGGLALLEQPDWPILSSKRSGVDAWLKSPVRLAPHDALPAPLKTTLEELKGRGSAARSRQRVLRDKADALRLSRQQGVSRQKL